MAKGKKLDQDSSTNKRDSAKEERNARDEDIEDSPRDQERLEPDETTIDLPDVKDIPGQEFIHVPHIGEMADTTIASDDEEGVGLFNDDEEESEDEENQNR